MSITQIEMLLLLVGLFWLTPRKYQLLTSIIAGVGYLALEQEYWSLGLLTVLSITSFFVAHQESRPKLISGLIVVIINFAMYKLLQAHESASANSLVLLGTSYYCMRFIHYLIEGYKGSLPSHSFTQFLSYSFFLPTFLVGPINRFQDFVRDDFRRRWDSKLFISGLERIIFGYFKIVVLADYLVATKLHTYAQLQGGDTTAIGAYLLCLEYGLNLYFKFGGYSDIAIGVSAMMGFRIIENFHYPFLKSNINKFWQSWHISLSSWCRDYVYSPVSSKLRNHVLGITVSMLVLGLWHEVSLKYIAWGLYHALGIVVFRYWQTITFPKLTKGALPKVITYPLATALTFNFVILSFAITRAGSLTEALKIYLKIFSGIV